MEHVTKFKFFSPCTTTISAPTSAGKTFLMIQILKNREELFTEPVTQVIWCYAIFQKQFDEFKNDKNFIFNEGICDISTLNDMKHTVIIIDDLMHRLNKSVAEMFTVHSHHRNLSIFFLNQNLFYRNVNMRDVNLNTQYLILFAQRRDMSQINILAGQVMPYERQKFMSIYKEFTYTKYGYMLCDFHPHNRHRFLLRTNILPNQVETVYIPE